MTSFHFHISLKPPPAPSNQQCHQQRQPHSNRQPEQVASAEIPEKFQPFRSHKNQGKIHHNSHSLAGCKISGTTCPCRAIAAN